MPEQFKNDKKFLSFLWDNLSPRDRMKILNNSPKTVWCFGAGASHHYAMNSRGIRIPLANDFFVAFNSLPTSEGFHAHVGPFINYLYRSRGIKPTEVTNWRENIEEFMTSVEREADELKGKINAHEKLEPDELEKKLSVATTFNNMTFILANVINEAQNGPSNTAYHELLKFCSPNDTFISFNWDTLLDRALSDSGLWSPNNGYGLSFSLMLDSAWKTEMDSTHVVKTNLRLLKLHGSTNWLVPYTGLQATTLEYKAIIPADDKVFLYWQTPLPYATHKERWRGGYVQLCYGYYPPNLPLTAFSKDSLSVAPGHLLVKGYLKNFFSPFKEPEDTGIPSSPLLITPILQKKYERYASTIESLWGQSQVAFSVTDRIVIIGYSFPPTDTRQLEILRATLELRKGDISIEIVDPHADDIADRIGSTHLAKAKDVKIHSTKFEDYLDLLWENAPTIIMKAAEKDEDVRKWIELIYGMYNSSIYSQSSDS